MKKFVRGRVGRAISSLLMALLLLPCLTLSLSTIGQAANNGRQDIILLPLNTSVGNAPDNLSGRILQELQILLAGQVGVQVNELTPNSPIIIRAKEQLGEDAKELMDQYNLAVDPTTKPGDRIKAAGYLVDKLGVDAVVYGTIDQYEFTSDPDPKQSLIHLTATKVTLDKSAEPVASLIIAVGKSHSRLNDKSPRELHDQEAITDVADNLSAQVTGRMIKPATQTPAVITGGKKSPGGGNSLLMILGLALIGAAIGAGSGGSHGSSPSTPATTTPPSAPSNLIITEEKATAQGFQYYTGFPVLTWTASTTSAVAEYDVYRQDTASVQSRLEQSVTYAGNKLPVSRGNGGRSTRSRTMTVSRVPVAGGATLVKKLYGHNATTWTDNTLSQSDNGKRYTYNILAVAYAGANGTKPLSSDFNLCTANWTVNINQPGTVTGLTAQLNSANVDLAWTAPSTFANGSSIILPGTFEVYASSALPQGTTSQTPAQVLGSSSLFKFVSSVVWSANMTDYTFEDTNAPENATVSYVIVAKDANGHFATTGNYPVAQIPTPIKQGIQVTTDQAQLSVVDQQNPQTALNSTYSPSAKITAKVIKNGQPLPGQEVTFTSSDVTGTIDTTNAQTTTDDNGEAWITYWGGYKPGQVTITATSKIPSGTGQTTLTGNVPITMFAGKPSQLTLLLSKITASSGSGTVAVKDANGNPIQGVKVKLSVLPTQFTLSPTEVTTDANGVNTFTIYTNGQTGEADVTAQVDGVSPQTQPIQFMEQANPVLVSGNTRVSMGSTTNYTMLLKDKTWQPLMNAAVKATITGGSFSSTSPDVKQTTLTTSGTGQLSFSFTAPSLLGDITLQFFDAQLNQIGKDFVITVAIPGPATLTANPVSSSEVDLTWSAVANANTYEIQRGPDGTTWPDPPIQVNTTSYADKQLAPGTQYFYQVRANTDAGNSDWSVVKSALTLPDKPNIPTATVKSSMEIDLTWNAIAGVTGYRIMREDMSLANPTFIQIPGTLPSTQTSYQDTNLKPNTTYRYEVAAVNDSGTSTSDYVQATTWSSIPVTAIKNTLQYQRIYFSEADNDQIAVITSQSANPTPVKTQITITGTGAGNVPAASETVTISTDKGTFEATSSNQTLSTDMKKITGTLDAAGNIVVLFKGRPQQVGGNPNSGLTLPDPSGNELGAPSIYLTNQGHTFDLKASGTVPVLVGPPRYISLNVPAAPVFNDPNAAVPTTITAAVTDMAHQAVMPNMPIWVVQSFSQYQPSSDPYQYDYNGAVGPANILTAEPVTDATGMITTSFTSNHSGLYTVNCFALNKNYTLPQYSALIDQINAAGITASDIVNIKPALITADGSTPVNGKGNVLAMNYVYNDRWQIIDTSPSRIDNGGLMVSHVSFRGFDVDNKPVLPGTPFKISADILCALGVPVATSRLELANKTPVDQNMMLTFGDHSIGDIYSRGTGVVGTVRLTFDNTASSTMRTYSIPNVVTHYGPALSSATVSVTQVPASMLIAGSDQMNNVQAHKQLPLTITVTRQANNFPDGYVVMLRDENGSVVTNNVTQVGILQNGQVNLIYSSPLNGASSALHNISVDIIGEEDTQHAEKVLPVLKPVTNMPLVAMVVRPSIALVTPNDMNITQLATNDTFSVSGIVYDDTGYPVFDGYTIKYRLVSAGGSMIPTVVIPDSITDINGLVTSAAFNTGGIVSKYKVELYCKDIFGSEYVLGDSGEFHIGLEAPSLTVLTQNTTATTITVKIDDSKNSPSEVQDYDLQYQPAAGTWTSAVPAPLAGTTTYIINGTGNGLTTKTSYSLRIRAHTIGTDGKDIYSAWSQIVTATTQ